MCVIQGQHQSKEDEERHHSLVNLYLGEQFQISHQNHIITTTVYWFNLRSRFSNLFCRGE